MITLLLAGTVFHQILVVELPQNGKNTLHVGEAQHRLLGAREASALADSLEGVGATLVAAPALLEATGEGAEIRVDSDDSSFRLQVREWRGSTSLDLRLMDGKRLVADMSARFAVPDGATFTLPIGDHHLLIARKDELEETETPEAASAEFRNSWKSLLGDARR